MASPGVNVRSPTYQTQFIFPKLPPQKTLPPLLPTSLSQLLTSPGPPLVRPRRRNLLRHIPAINPIGEIESSRDRCRVRSEEQVDTEGEGGVDEEDDAEGE